MTMHSASLHRLMSVGWQVKPRSNASLLLPEAVAKKHSSLPADLLSFLGSFDSCSNPDDTAWFLSEADYMGLSSAAFHWNEFELQSIAAAADDQSWVEEIEEFWSSHFPFFLWVQPFHGYFALSTGLRYPGAVVYGSEPEYEEVKPIAPSFSSFLEKLLGSISNQTATWPDLCQELIRT